MNSKKKKILVLYANAFYPMHDTYRVHLRCFKRYSKHLVFYFNVDTGPLPKRLQKVDFDVIIFHTLFMSSRHLGREHFGTLLDRISFLTDSKALKLIMPQDEWIYTNLMVEMINRFKIDVVCTCAVASEWFVIYNGVNPDQVKFHRILTGYIDEDTLARIEGYKSIHKEKKFDLTYRVGEIKPWLGKHGLLKKDLVDIFNDALEGSNLNYSLSYDGKDRFWGDDWFIFLMESKYCLGMEGGASVLDPDGDIMRKGLEMEKNGRKLTYEESRALLFPDGEGNLKLFAISPRHLECCITETCQVLVEGEYFGILKPGVHYLELKRDMSNLQEVIEDIVNDEKRDKIVKKAYEDVVGSGLYTYPNFVTEIERLCFETSEYNSIPPSLTEKFHFFQNNFIDGYHYQKISLRNKWITKPLDLLRNLGLAKFKKVLGK
ncbi:MAG: hypothetical protein MRY83_08660 [Flavobacteriales bacterium]|nr:hypothetical protein [Flavobacteriales bacterium]